MKNTKRIIALFLTLLFILSLCACGTINSPINSDSDTNTDTGSDQSSDTSTGTDAETDAESNTDTSGDAGEDFNIENSDYSEDDFTVALRYNGELYIPEDSITVYWTNDNTLESCTIGSDGFAGSKVLDGNYRVTLSHVPEGMAYDPNAHEATNDDRHIIVDIYDLHVTKGAGRDPYNGISLSTTAVYSVKLNSSTHTVYFDFVPREEGSYTVESWMDTTEEKYNPYCDAYTGSVAYKLFDKTIDGGGAEGLYTKNFKNGIEVTSDMIGNVLTFGIHVDAKNAENYPVEVVFAIKLNDGFSPTKLAGYDMYVPLDPYAYIDGCIDYGSEYEIMYPETQIPGRDAYEFIDQRYQLWSKDAGGDGYYHVYDLTKYSRTNYPNGYRDGYPEGYGPILYANISVPCRFLDRPFTNFEIESKPLSIKVSDDLKINYKHFIEGYSALAKRADDPLFGLQSSYYCYMNCRCHPEDQEYNYSCLEGCTNCLSDCRQVKKELVLEYDADGNPISYFEGLAAYVNEDGGVAVTEELKTFLYRLSVAQRYFADGEGWCETNEELSIDASDASQWLFACYYYEKIN